MKNIEQIKTDYIAALNKVAVVDHLIDKREAQIERLKKKRNKLLESSWWGDLLIRPVMEAVKERFPQLHWDDARLSPMGLRCAVSVFGSYSPYDEKADFSQTAVGITFTHSNYEGVNLYFDNGKTISEYGINTLGSINGFNNQTTEITNFEALFEYVESQIKAFDEFKLKEKTLTALHTE